ncbi:MAG: AraC family transcriptional regulator [Marinobacter sp.]|uniref:AraC family transcriptional regulator n=1 Tax=Marinobacter sp. TaxID=50741 RepID=UPI00299CD6B4|nr:AraC family transcriptional regulator [Marinobacter sp.]MDX1755253.1 AraC family transcriptional regulator [Marinobacter sp.]
MSNLSKPGHTPTVPGSYVLLLVDVVSRWHFSMETLLEGSPIDPDRLLRSDCRIELPRFAALVKRAVELTGEPGLGYHLGLQMKVSYHGLIGQAAMVAQTMGEAVEILREFFHLQSSILSVTVERDGDQVALVFEETHPQYPLGRVGIQFLLLGFATMGETLTGQPVRGEGRARFSRPPYFDRYQHLLPGKVRFNQPFNGLVFPAEMMDRPLVMADPIAARLAREQCKQELNRLAGESSIARLVRDLAFDEVQGFATLEEVAAKLHMSPRTLQRRLGEERITYRDLVEHIRRDKALRLVSAGSHSVGQVADLLGYGDVTNFSRAFRRWTGESPRGYRRQQQFSERD